jgi:hypothetical protein
MPPDSSLHRPVRRLWPKEGVTRNESRCFRGFKVGADGSKGFCVEGAFSLPPELVRPRHVPWPTELGRRCGAPLPSEGSLARSHQQRRKRASKSGSNMSGDPQRGRATARLVQNGPLSETIVPLRPCVSRIPPNETEISRGRGW